MYGNPHIFDPQIPPSLPPSASRSIRRQLSALSSQRRGG